MLWLIILYALLQAGYVAWVALRRHTDLTIPQPHPYALGNPDAKTCIILVHGFADGPQAWQREAEELAQRGYRVVVPHLCHTETADAWLAQLEALLKDLRTQHKQLILWGHSMGAALSLIVSQRIVPDALVLWAPYCAPRLGRRFAKLLYCLHRLLFLYPWSPTFFPSERHGKGSPETHYRIRRIISRKTFASVLAVPDYLPPPPTLPTILLLSQRDTVVDNHVTLATLPQAHLLWAHNPTSSHALTNASDWQENLDATLQALALEV